MTIPAKFSKRVHENLKKYQEIIFALKKKDANEADTVRVVAGILECIFGYNRFTEVTSEYAIRGTYCDLAVIDSRKKIRILVEVKAASSTLNESHVKQAVDYGANAGVNWVILTNSDKWILYKIKFGKPISKEVVSEFDLLSLTSKSVKELEAMYAISRDGQDKSVIDDYYMSKQAKSKYIIGALLFSPDMCVLIRKNMKKLYPDVKITDDEIADIMAHDIIKREILDSEESKKARKDIEKAMKKLERTKGEAQGGESVKSDGAETADKENTDG